MHARIPSSIYLGSPERARTAGIGPRGTNPSDCLNLGNSYSITYWQTDPGSSDLARLEGSVRLLHFIKELSWAALSLRKVN